MCFFFSFPVCNTKFFLSFNNINNCHYNIITIKLLLQKTITIIIINNNDHNSYTNISRKNAFKNKKNLKKKNERKKDKKKDREKRRRRNKWELVILCHVSGPVHPRQRNRIDRSTLGCYQCCSGMIHFSAADGGDYETLTLPRFRKQTKKQPKDRLFVKYFGFVALCVICVCVRVCVRERICVCLYLYRCVYIRLCADASRWWRRQDRKGSPGGAGWWLGPGSEGQWVTQFVQSVRKTRRWAFLFLEGAHMHAHTHAHTYTHTHADTHDGGLAWRSWTQETDMELYTHCTNTWGARERERLLWIIRYISGEFQNINEHTSHYRRFRHQPAPCCTEGLGVYRWAACRWCRRRGNTKPSAARPPRYTLQTYAHTQNCSSKLSVFGIRE